LLDCGEIFEKEAGRAADAISYAHLTRRVRITGTGPHGETPPYE